MKKIRAIDCLTPLWIIPFMIFLVIIFQGCRKIDRPANDQSLKQIEEKFLTLPANSSPELQRVVNKIREQNDKFHFIPEFVKKNGYPVWQKVFWNNSSSQIRSESQRSNTINDTLLFFIPLQQSTGAAINSYITCLSPDSNDYRFRYYNKMAIEALQSVDSTRKHFLENVLSVLGYFNKQIINKDTLYVAGVFNEAIFNVTVNFGDAQTGGRSFRPSLQSLLVEICRTLYCFRPSGFLVCVDVWADYWDGPTVSPYGVEWWLEGGGGGGSGGGGGGGGGTSTAVEYLVNNLNLNSTQQLWLTENPFEASQIYEALQESLNQDPIAENTFSTIPPPEALAAAQITIEAAMNGLINGLYDNGHYNLIKQYIPGYQSYPSIDPEFWAYFSLRCALIKLDHPEYGIIRVYWEAMKDILHTGLDVVGLFPIVGEIADLVNGAIYTLEGKGVDATLSFASAIPVAGWFSAGIKYAKRGVDLANGTRTTLKWIKRTDNLIDFGERSQLRTVLGLAKGDARVAHHVIPWKFWDNPVVQTAAKHNDAFHLNELLNGIPLSTAVHSGNHAQYIQKIEQKLQLILTQNPNLTPTLAKQKLTELINSIKTAIQNNPSVHIDNLVF